MSRDEKAHRKALRDLYKQGEKQTTMIALILDRPALDALLDHLDERLSEDGCDHTLRLTQAWAEQESRDWSSLADALREAGGYCDCEVMANVDPDG